MGGPSRCAVVSRSEILAEALRYLFRRNILKVLEDEGDAIKADGQCEGEGLSN